MTDTLFDLPDSPSPRLEWMRRHGVMTEYISDDPTGEFNGWCAHYADDDPYKSPFPWLGWGYGENELEALTEFAIKNNLKLWNEE